MRYAIAAFIAIVSLVSSAYDQRPAVAITTEDVADLLFPRMRISYDSLYLARLMLRFSEPDMQIVIIASATEVDISEYKTKGNVRIAELIRRSTQENASVTAAHIASNIRIKTRHVATTRQQVKTWFEELQNIKGSPKLDGYTCLHGCPQFDLWFDTGQDSVHYSMVYTPVIPPQRSTQQLLAEWMLSLRSQIEAAPTASPR
jgi:hypothetical protein